MIITFLKFGFSCVLVSSSSKLSVASRASLCQGICWWPIDIGFAFSVLSFSSTDSLFFIESVANLLIKIRNYSAHHKFEVFKYEVQLP